MKETTLCYIEKDEAYLMLYRNSKPDDPNEGKWIGLGGKLEAGETADDCVLREIREEAGVILTSYEYRGVVHFSSDVWESEEMYLYTADGFEGEIAADCDEGELHWVRKDELFTLKMWEGDRLFLEKLARGDREIDLSLRYEGDKLVEVIDI